MVHIGNTFEQAIAKFYNESDFSLIQDTIFLAMWDSLKLMPYKISLQKSILILRWSPIERL